MISCHISNQALKSRLLPLAGAQIRRRIRQGSLVLCPNITSLASDRLSPRRPTNNEVLLTSLPDISTENDGCCQQNSIAEKFTFPKQKMIYLNDTLKSQNEQEESKAKTHRLNDLMLFEKSKQTEVKQTAYHINSVDSIQDLCMNRCYTSPINWPSLSHNNLGLKETGCNVSEVIPSLFNETKNYRDDVGGSKDLVENDDLQRQSDSAVEESSNSVAIWKTMPGRLLRRAKTQYIQSISEKSRNDKVLTNISRQKDDTSTLNFLIANTISLAPRTKSFLPQLRQSQSTGKYGSRQMLKHHIEENNQISSFTSLPVLIKPPPPSPDTKFPEFSLNLSCNGMNY
ncbi:unnamed protein product [Trichobilharzia regenti]|nr:unnamed protein product [Trichobilharzia regenti]